MSPDNNNMPNIFKRFFKRSENLPTGSDVASTQEQNPKPEFDQALLTENIEGVNKIEAQKLRELIDECLIAIEFTAGAISVGRLIFLTMVESVSRGAVPAINPEHIVPTIIATLGAAALGGFAAFEIFEGLNKKVAAKISQWLEHKKAGLEKNGSLI